ncbi:MAG: hypothetical protein ACI8YI_000261 [Paracoccaceae bacterium]|jgi:hypothetical protein
MVASSLLSGVGSPGGTKKGQLFNCRDCDTKVLIRDKGALFLGAVISAFWLIAAYFALIKGPLWYYRDWEHLVSSGSNSSFLLLDGLFALLSLGLIGLSLWVFWAFLLSPLRDRSLNPVIGENRARSFAEATDIRANRRQAMLAFFVYPLVIWVPLLALLYSMDMMNIDMRGNGIGKNALVFGLLALIYYLARRIGIRAHYALIGMAFWLVVFVSVVFIFG